MSGRVYFAAATILLSLSLCSAAVRAQEDPSVTRAREVARLQYQREKADRLAAEIAHTRQGVSQSTIR